MLMNITEEVIREREEIHDQIDALNELKEMAANYGFDISDLLQMLKKLFNGYTLVI